MPVININIKVKGGPRTPVQVVPYCTAINEKSLRFANGNVVTETQIANWIEEELTKKLQGIQNAEKED